MYSFLQDDAGVQLLAGQTAGGRGGRRRDQCHNESRSFESWQMCMVTDRCKSRMRADDDGIIIARSWIQDLGSCNPESIEQRQIDDSICQTSGILKVINLALFLGDEEKLFMQKSCMQMRAAMPHTSP